MPKTRLPEVFLAKHGLPLIRRIGARPKEHRRYPTISEHPPYFGAIEATNRHIMTDRKTSLVLHWVEIRKGEDHEKALTPHFALTAEY